MKIKPLHIYLIYYTKERIGHTKCVRLLLHSVKKNCIFPIEKILCNRLRE